MKPAYGPKFTATRREHELIRKIVRRAVAMAEDASIDYDVISASMDIEACHCNGMPLDLARLVDADDATFGHDVFGIRRFINRETGEIGGCFVPRTAAPQPATA